MKTSNVGTVLAFIDAVVSSKADAKGNRTISVSPETAAKVGDAAGSLLREMQVISRYAAISEQPVFDEYMAAALQSVIINGVGEQVDGPTNYSDAAKVACMYALAGIKERADFVTIKAEDEVDSEDQLELPDMEEEVEEEEVEEGEEGEEEEEGEDDEAVTPEIIDLPPGSDSDIN